MARCFAVWLALLWAACLGRAARAGDPHLGEGIDRALAAGGKYLASQQTPGGAWKSSVYGPFKDGPSLSAQVLAGLCAVPRAEELHGDAIRRGRMYLSSLVHSQREADAGRPFSIYTASFAAQLATGENARDQAWWDRFIRNRQLTADLLWNPSDPSFGGWSYSIGPPMKPGPGHAHNPMAFSNISATVSALDALRFAKAPKDDPAFAAALVFVKRCQNYSDDPTAGDAKFDDGGFFFTPNDAAWNKAGAAGTDRLGRTRFHSYGAAAADGLRALLDAGMAPDAPRAAAARKWIKDHFNARANPGVFEPDREALRNATYYYWAASVTRAMAQFEDGAQEKQLWAWSLAMELVARQREDGSWANESTDSKEDDPLVATPAALLALARCRELLGR